MIRYFLLTLMSVTIAFTACNAVKKGQMDTVAQDGQSLLWRISGNGLERPSYLYGTIHLISPNDFKFGDHLRHTLANSEVIALEIPLDEASLGKAAMGMMYKGDSTIADILTPAQLDTLKHFFLDTLGVSEFEWLTYQKMKPFGLSQVVTLQMLDEAPMSFELEFKKIADSLSIPIVGLERVEDQLAVVNTIPLETQIDMLLQSTTAYQETEAEFDKMVRYYNRQNLDSLFATMHQDHEEFMEFSEAFLDQRNRNWIPVIDSLVKANKTFIAVGAGHLPGDQGVIQLLKDRGYTLTPIETH